MTRSKTFFIVAVAAVVATAGVLSIRSCSSTESLAGVDSNHDGVRDDVEKFIVDHYPDEKVRIVARELHKGTQEVMLDSKSDGKRALFAIDCLFDVAPDIAGKVVDEIEAETANTLPRIVAYWKANQRFSGSILPRAKSKEEACGFAPRLLEKK